MLHCCCYMDGRTAGIGYRFTISQSYGIGYKAFSTVAGLKYFMKHYGLSVDRSTVQMHDMRSIGKGRVVTFAFKPKEIEDVYFWHQDEVPVDAEWFLGLENGSYVNLYAVDKGDKVTIYRPNPNAKEVYVPWDYQACSKLYG